MNVEGFTFMCHLTSNVTKHIVKIDNCNAYNYQQDNTHMYLEQ